MLNRKTCIALVVVLVMFAALSAEDVSGAPLTCTVSPSDGIKVNSTLQVKAGGGTGPYWLTISNPGLVLYTPSKLDKSGRPDGVWGMSAIKAGQTSFTIKDAKGATASASITIAALASATPQPVVPPLTATVSTRSPYTRDDFTFTVTGGAKPYQVTGENAADITITAASDTTWKVKALKAGAFKITVQDSGKRVYSIEGMAQDRPILLNTLIDGSKLYWQVPSGSVQKPIRMQIVTGNPPYSVIIDSGYLNMQQTGTNIYSFTSTGRGGDTTITVRDSKMQEKIWPIHTAKPLTVQWEPKDKKLKPGEGFTVYILSGEPPFSVKAWAPGSYVGEGLKDSRYVASYFVGGLKAGVHKINVTDASYPATNFGYQFEVTVAP